MLATIEIEVRKREIYEEKLRGDLKIDHIDFVENKNKDKKRMRKKNKRNKKKKKKN